jgi:hypothetical protein
MLDSSQFRIAVLAFVKANLFTNSSAVSSCRGNSSTSTGHTSALHPVSLNRSFRRGEAEARMNVVVPGSVDIVKFIAPNTQINLLNLHTTGIE